MPSPKLLVSRSVNDFRTAVKLRESSLLSSYATAITCARGSSANLGWGRRVGDVLVVTLLIRQQNFKRWAMMSAQADRQILQGCGLRYYCSVLSIRIEAKVEFRLSSGLTDISAKLRSRPAIRSTAFGGS